MNVVLKTGERTLVSLSADEVLGIANALNEVCNGVHISDAEFSTRLGVQRAALADLLRQFNSEPAEAVRKYELVDVWAEPASLMLRSVTVFGDAVEMSTSEAKSVVCQLEGAIAAAS